MSVRLLSFLLCATTVLVLTFTMLAGKMDTPIRRPLIHLMFLLAGMQGAIILTDLDPAHVIIWKQITLAGELALPVIVGWACLKLVQHESSNPEMFGDGWWKAMASGAIILAGLLLGLPDRFLQVSSSGGVLFTHPSGMAFWGAIVVAWCLVARRLEQIIRSFRDPLRYRLIYILVGLLGISCISIIQALGMFWEPASSQDLTPAWELATVTSVCFVGFGLKRWQQFPAGPKIHMSHHAIFTTLAIMAGSAYMGVWGLLALLIQRTDWELKESLGALVLFFAILGLVGGLLSRRIRTTFHSVIARHFLRSKYDYREKWLEMSEVFTGCKDDQQVWNRYLQWLSHTFGASRITIWKFFSVDGRYHQIRKDRRRRHWKKTADPDPIQTPTSIPAHHPVIVRLKQGNGSVVCTDRQCADKDWLDFLQRTQARVCVPLIAREDRLIGFCTLSQPSHEGQYDDDDCTLLRAIGHHVTMLLSQFEMVEERNSAAKWEAVHRFAAFYLHDLKNLASSLSMVAQNAEEYGSNPDFQISAMRTVKSTSQRIITLMDELARQAKNPDPCKGSASDNVDINTLIQDTLSAVSGSGCRLKFHPGLGLPRLSLKPDGIKQVVLNLILNARHATGTHGTVDIVTACDGEQVILEIHDTGKGMSTGQLECLFQPFKSSKNNGLGVGLFQCKRIVEDHHGRIHVESQLGRGTSVIITFPVQMTDIAETDGAALTAAGMTNVPTHDGHYED